MVRTVRSVWGCAAWGSVVLVAAASCNTLTGEGSYASVGHCTGPSCTDLCAIRGGTWDVASSTCACAGGQALCGSGVDDFGVPYGSCCGGSAPYCVLDPTEGPRCSACEAADFECGYFACCNHQTCLNATLGACGASYGSRAQSCAGGLVCPVPTLTGTTENADCCESIAVPGGTFDMGCSRSATCDNDEYDDDAAITVSSFALDRFEVTVGRFRRFVDSWDYAGLPVGAGGSAYVARAGWQGAWDANLPATKADFERRLACDPAAATWTDAPGYNENLPINCVTWYEAFAFCAWDGGRLATEAEWEFAASNGKTHDLYPWGASNPTLDSAVYACAYDTPACAYPPPFPAVVGSRPLGANTWGHRDLAGNVEEWVLDTYSYYGDSAATDPADVTDGFRVVRGGFWDQLADVLETTVRAPAKPTFRATGPGVRCARDE